MLSVQCKFIRLCFTCLYTLLENLSSYLSQQANNGNAKAFVPKNIDDIIIPTSVCLTSFCDGTLPRIKEAN